MSFNRSHPTLNRPQWENRHRRSGTKPSAAPCTITRPGSSPFIGVSLRAHRFLFDSSSLAGAARDGCHRAAAGFELEELVDGNSPLPRATTPRLECPGVKLAIHHAAPSSCKAGAEDGSRETTDRARPQTAEHRLSRCRSPHDAGGSRRTIAGGQRRSEPGGCAGSASRDDGRFRSVA